MREPAADNGYQAGHLRLLSDSLKHWQTITALPSRLSAETPLQAERDALLRRVAEQGYIDDYAGIRIADSGRRFSIQQATVWNLIDADQQPCGQAALFSHWQLLADR